MTKRGVQFVCSSCGAVSASWSGRCFSCGEWNTLQEQLDVTQNAITKDGRVLSTQSVGASITKDLPRLKSGIQEVDNVLGGGFVAGSVNLIAGQPGIGKSTLLLQLAYTLSDNQSILYVSGEESEHQIGLRAERLGTKSQKLQLATSTVADDIAATIAGGKYQLVIVDSIQTVACSAIASAAGTVSQITNSTQLLTAAAKKTNTALILVGHVTKEGAIAGPKVLEHLVDVVLQLEGDRYGGFKVLRAIKNRYGSTNEAGIFEMTDNGLQPVANPSAALLAERQITDGSVILATLEGTRPLLVEVQALVNRTSYGYPKRAASGFDLNRLNLLVAMLEKRTKLNLADQDIYINIVGGLRLTEPAADLAICMAIASASKGMQLKKNAVVFGEVGLSGEVRHVPHVDKRVAEAKKLGFDGAIGPIIKTGKKPALYSGVQDVRSALNTFLEKD
ncbi:DNA repair protein RadA [Candidatus Saccharibacteria bacterium]|nr:DNA repair protein RadA [Candidatus Saccharibacteria bacterium]MBI3338117.1 DNA repair protein RadA [Candidatus Saccharibacteria bacterium]